MARHEVHTPSGDVTIQRSKPLAQLSAILQALGLRVLVLSELQPAAFVRKLGILVYSSHRRMGDGGCRGPQGSVPLLTLTGPS
jgi:hypothetical protein